MTNEDGVVTQLRLRRESLENPNCFRMDFYKAEDLGHDLHFRISVLSEGKAIVKPIGRDLTTKGLHWRLEFFAWH